MYKYTEEQFITDTRRLDIYRDSGIQGYWDTGIQAYKYEGKQGYRDSRIQGYWDTGIQAYKYEGKQGYRDSRIQGLQRNGLVQGCRIIYWDHRIRNIRKMTSIHLTGRWLFC